MDTMWDLLYGWIGLLAIVCLVGYYFLSRALAKTNQVLVVWQKIAETPVLGNHVGSIFTMLMKIRNPYSRSIRTSPGPTFSPFLISRLPDYVVGSGAVSGIFKASTHLRWTLPLYPWRSPYIIRRDTSRSRRLHPTGPKRKRNPYEN
jgi:hypothetical protein